SFCLPQNISDRCLEPLAEGACSEYVLLWYFHPRSGECRPFVYGGCGGNRNQFSSRQQCQTCCEKENTGRYTHQIHIKNVNVKNIVIL
uniref:BPTI/Kunitz inhibitor domain-containing protein n=1 Tax=Scophthalmus maximus TaxID=52904 RepID=A0A8D2ZFF6_SCOMX